VTTLDFYRTLAHVATALREQVPPEDRHEDLDGLVVALREAARLAPLPDTSSTATVLRLVPR
jgi:hypothetical protein